MGQNMMATGCTIKYMVKVNINGMMAENIMENGKMIS